MDQGSWWATVKLLLRNEASRAYSIKQALCQIHGFSGSQIHKRYKGKSSFLLHNIWGCRWGWFDSQGLKSFRTLFPNFFDIRDQFHGRQFLHGCGERGVWYDSSTLHLLCTLSLFLLHQLHLRSSGIRSQKLGTPDLKEPSSTFPAVDVGHWRKQLRLLTRV